MTERVRMTSGLVALVAQMICSDMTFVKDLPDQIFKVFSTTARSSTTMFSPASSHVGVANKSIFVDDYG